MGKCPVCKGPKFLCNYGLGFCDGIEWTVNRSFKNVMDALQNVKLNRESVNLSKDRQKIKFEEEVKKVNDSKGNNNLNFWSRTILIKNLSNEIFSRDLKVIARQYGPVEKSQLGWPIGNRKNNFDQEQNRFAKVTFENHKDAALAIEKLHHCGLDHMILNVEWDNLKSHPEKKNKPKKRNQRRAA